METGQIEKEFFVTFLGKSPLTLATGFFVGIAICHQGFMVTAPTVINPQRKSLYIPFTNGQSIIGN